MDIQKSHSTEFVQLTVSPATLGEKYPSVIKSFYEEHLHIDEEIRYIVDGEGYEDVLHPDPAQPRRIVDFRILVH